MTIDGTFCAGKYRVRTVSSEMKMSHWIDAPFVESTEVGAIVLDLTAELWDLQDIREEGDVLILVIRKYPGITNDIEVRILPQQDRFALAGKIVTRQQLITELRLFP